MQIDIYASFERLLNELRQLKQPDAVQKEKLTLPSFISAGREGAVIVNSAIDAEIRTIADWLREQRPAINAQYSMKEWRSAVRSAFGPILSSIDLNEDVVKVAKDAKRQLESWVYGGSEIKSPNIISFGCELFRNGLASPIQIGPVLFESRDLWLDRALKIGQVSEVGHSTLKNASKERDGDKSIDSHAEVEHFILNRLLKSRLICTVETSNFAPEMAMARAITGARLAQFSIALLWRRPSEILMGFHLSPNHSHRRVEAVSFAPEKGTTFHAQLVGLPFGPDMPAEQWAALTVTRRRFFDVAGGIISCLTDGMAKPSDLQKSLAGALWFFWEGCHDENDLMAIVKFTGALEHLSRGSGERAAGILRLSCVRFECEADVKYTADKNLKQFVDHIYSHCRSRTLHGSNPFFHHDWSKDRFLAELFTRNCLMACIDWFGSNPNATDPKNLFDV